MADWRIGIDVGGTFTDIVAAGPCGAYRAAKAPSDVGNVIAALTACLAAVELPWSDVRELVHGTTRITNAIVEGRLATVTLLATAGFADVLAVARQNRRELYRLDTPPRPAPLVPVERRLEVAERMGPRGECRLALSEKEICRAVDAAVATGAEAVAVALLHAYANGEHEARLGAALRARLPFVALSHETSPEAREYERTATTVLSAATMPMAAAYLDRLVTGIPDPVALHLVHSAGGMASAEALKLNPLGLTMSGPASGAAAAAQIAGELGISTALAFDMGGTTTDVCLIRDGVAGLTDQRSLGEHPIRQPMVDVRSVGAGGGSIARVTAGGLSVGPQSAGADPGPAAYGLGGAEPTVTDADLVLGYLRDGAVLGQGGVTLDLAAAERAVASVGTALGVEVMDAALGVHRVANAAMARAVAAVTVERGIDPRQATLIAYGGAGPMHAVALAREVGIGRIVVPRFSSSFSAAGCLAVRPSYQQQRMVRMQSDHWDGARIAGLITDLGARLAAPLLAAHHDADELETRCTALMRYAGQSYAVEIPTTVVPDPDRLGRDFRDRHESLYGFATEEAWELESIRVEVATRSGADGLGVSVHTAEVLAEPHLTLPCCYASAGLVATPRFDRYRLAAGQRLVGPAVVEDAWTTIVLPPGATLRAADTGDLLIDVGEGDPAP